MNRSGIVNLQVKTSFITAYGLSDPGQQRDENEDTIFIDDQGRYLIVADGMGGQQNGARASALAVEVVNRQLMPQRIQQELADITQADNVPPEIGGLCSVIGAAVHQAGRQVYGINTRESESEYDFMGTTMAGLYLSKGYIIGFHIGDSRIYRLHNKSLTRLTRDHSMYQDWVDSGKIGKSPKKNILTRAIGFDQYVETDIHFSKCARNDLYLLCSDGLTNMVSEQRIEAVLNGYADIADAAQVLINDANSAGGADNISAVLCRIDKL